MMKGKFFFGAAAALLLTGCAQNEILDQQSDKDGINYAVTTGAISRAQNPYCNTNLPGAFNVAAAKAGSSELYFENDRVALTDGKWLSDTQRYWPEYNLDFHAWVDDADTYDYNGGNPRFLNYTIAQDCNKQLDLMYAVMKNQTRQTVKLNFRHALSQIVFKAVNNSGLDITVKEVKVGHLYNQGTYTFPNANTDENYTNHEELPNGTEGDLTRGTWGINQNGGAVNEYSTGTFDVALSTEVQSLTTASHNGGPDKSLILLPQEQKAWNPAQTGSTYNGAYFMLYVVIKQGDKVIRDGYTVIPATINWEQGIRYTYTFRFTAGGTGGYNPDPNNPYPTIQGITYDVTTDDFVPVGPIDTPDTPNTGDEYKYAYVTLDNGADATPATQTLRGQSLAEGDVRVNLPATAPVRDGYDFKGWKDAEGNTYGLGGFVMVPEGQTKTLTAVWEKQIKTIKYRINFIANPLNASVPVTNMPNPDFLEVEVPETQESYTFTIPSTIPVHGGYNFAGWGFKAINYADDPHVDAGATYTVSKSNPTVNLYAVWGVKFTGGSTPGAGGSEW